MNKKGIFIGGILVLSLGAPLYAGDTPVPFKTLNDYFELAPGESYSLVGKLTIEKRRAYLTVDLKLHPWLGSGDQKKIPKYRIETSPGTSLLPWDNHVVRVYAYARMRITKRFRNKYKISLELLKPPVSYDTSSEHPKKRKKVK